MNNNTTNLSATAKKYADIIASGKIEESQIISLRSFMGKTKDNANLIFRLLDGNSLSLFDTQVQKGYDFLLTLWKTPRGTERKNNPYGYREQKILDNFSTIELKSFYNAGNAYIDNYLPLYEVISKDGNSFEYYYNGEMNIVG